jgi:type VI secretion system protein
VGEALRNIFISQTDAYLPGVDAIRDGFEDIADHQVAVIAGMRAAFRSLLKRFDPAELQLRFDKLQGRGSLLAGKKGRYWDNYQEFYTDLANNMDAAFQDLFGEEFAQAYEQQMVRLETVRKKKT